jgi:lysophospholipase L1-like esterase
VKPLRIVALFFEALCAAFAMVMATLLHLPWPAAAGLALIVLALADAQVRSLRADPGPRSYTIPIAWVATVFALGGVIWSLQTWDTYHGVLTWLIATVILIAGQEQTLGPPARWRPLCMTWAFAGAFLWLGASYLEDLRIEFHIGVAVTLALLFLCKSWFRPRAFSIQAINTLILALIALPLADLYVRTNFVPDAALDPRNRPYSFEYATKHPAAFARWTEYFWRQYGNLMKEIAYPDPEGILPNRYRPGSRGWMFQSLVCINSNGFRGPEITEPKGNTYRIVALGESTTFGITMTPDDHPWPELLQQLIHDRLKLNRPVEVINAGASSFDLTHNIHRMQEQILPLKPDMIISYHGFNGFHLISEALPRVLVHLPPRFQDRALIILAEAEFQVRVLLYRHRQTARLTRHPPILSNPLGTEYARAYRQLIDIAHTNGIRLVLANYSMAVNGSSNPRVVAFYYRTTVVDWQVKANEAHTAIVTELARENPGVCLVDTHPGLDGVHDKFIDIMHFTPEGERQMAGNMFNGIASVLEKDVGVTSEAPVATTVR